MALYLRFAGSLGDSGIMGQDDELGRDGFHSVPLLPTENGHRMESVPTPLERWFTESLHLLLCAHGDQEPGARVGRKSTSPRWLYRAVFHNPG